MPGPGFCPPDPDVPEDDDDGYPEPIDTETSLERTLIADDAATWSFEPGVLALVYAGDDGVLRALDRPASLDGISARQRALAAALLRHCLTTLEEGPR